ncbi:MAG: SixA phosphatase family protein [Acidimicrobiales bacterium]
MAIHRDLWLLRHAKTVADPPKGGSDFDRVLAPRGRRDATALGHLLGTDRRQLGLVKLALPARALVSPAARTVATADLVLGELKRPPARDLVPALYDADPDDVLDHLRTLDDELTSVMVVGHNPTAHALALGLIDAADHKGRALVTRRGFPTCALGIYRFRLEHWSEAGGGTARLLKLLVPPFGQE